MGMLGGGMNSSDEDLERLLHESIKQSGVQEGLNKLWELMRKVAGKTITRSITQKCIEAHRTPQEWIRWAREYVSE